MKKGKYLFFIGMVFIAVITIFITKNVISYSNELKKDYYDIVDNRMVKVKNYGEFLELACKERQGLTGLIVYLSEEDDLEKSLELLGKISERGYNVYIIKGNVKNKYSVGKRIVREGRENINWILNKNSSNVNEVNELKIWMLENNYKTGEISNHINSFAINLDENKSLKEINNELNEIRNKINK
ncbi:hypothetical protein [Clostridium thermobutyricum]|uniref:hypothetical protein n=1 Tax=Clostridium thermobutyricum TaxID=29372 RepID=UPI003F528A3F